MMSEYEKQAEKFLEKHGLTFKAVFIGGKCPLWCDGKHIHGDLYRVTIRRKGARQSFTCNFWNSKNDADNGNTPTAYDVLATIEKSDPGTFADFCGNFGYDEDSRKAEKTYKLVKAQWEKVQRFFSPDEIEELQGIN